MQEEEQEGGAEAEGALIELSDAEDETLQLPASESQPMNEDEDDQEDPETLFFVSLSP